MTQDTDSIVAQLRCSKGWPTLGNSAADVIDAQAAHIAALEAKVARYEAALMQFADVADECDELELDDGMQAPVSAGDCRDARAALEGD